MERIGNPYGRERVITLLGELFGVYEEKGHLIYPNESQKEIAELIYTSPTTVNNWLNMDGPYKTFIQRLELYRDFNNMKERLARANKKFRIVSLALIATVLLCIIILARPISGTRSFKDLPDISNELSDTVSLNGFVVRDEGTLKKIRDFHSHMITHVLTYEAALINEYVRRNTNDRSPEQFMEDAMLKTLTSIEDGRSLLRDMNFVNERGQNVVVLIDSLFPRDSLFVSENSLFQPRFDDFVYLMMEESTSLSDLKRLIDTYSKSVGNTQWDMVWEAGWE